MYPVSFLFIIVIDYIMRKAMDQTGLGIEWKDDKRLTDLDFADDIALVAKQAHVRQQMMANLATHSVKLGLHISLEKTKIIQASQAATSQPIYLGQTELECVDQCTYLGSVISKDGDVEKEVNTRLATAATVFRRLSNIWKSGSLGLNIELQLYTAVFVSTAIYASKTWKSTRTIQNNLYVFHQRNLKKIIGVTWKDKVTNAKVLAHTGQRRLQDIVGEMKFRFAGHVMWMAPKCPARRAIEWTPADGRRKRGRPKKTWRSKFTEDLQARGVSWSEKETMTADRVRRRNLLPIVPQRIGGSKWQVRKNSGRFCAYAAENWLKLHEIVVQFRKYLDI